MSENLMLSQLPLEVDPNQYARGLGIYLDSLDRSVEEFAFEEYLYWEEFVADTEIATEGLPMLSVLHTMLKNIDRLSPTQQVELLAYWHAAKDQLLDSIEEVV